MFFLDPSVHCAPNDEMVVDFEMRRKERNHRLMHVRMVHHLEGPSPLAQVQMSLLVSTLHTSALCVYELLLDILV